MARSDFEDEQMRGLLRKKDRVEALGWLTSSPPGVSRGVGEMCDEDSVALVRKLYKWGVTEVIAVEIGISPNRRFESTDTLIVVLPDDAAVRKRVLDWNNKRSEKMGYEAIEEDRGQRYVLVWFD